MRLLALNKQRNNGTMRRMETGINNSSSKLAGNLLGYLAQKLAPRLGVDDYTSLIDVLKSIDGRLSAIIMRDDAIFYSITEMGELVLTEKTKANTITLLSYALSQADNDENTGVAVSFVSDNCILRLVKCRDRIGIGAIYNGDMEVLGIEALQDPISCYGELLVVKFDLSLVEDIVKSFL